MDGENTVVNLSFFPSSFLLHFSLKTSPSKIDLSLILLDVKNADSGNINMEGDVFSINLS